PLPGLDVAGVPTLLGHALTSPKRGSEVLLVVGAGYPLLAWRRHGTGVVAAFTADAGNQWAAEWLKWKGYGNFWNEVARLVTRRRFPQDETVTLQRGERSVAATIDAVDENANWLNGASARFVFDPPRNGQTEVSVPQVAPGRYELTLDSPATDSARFMAYLDGPQGPRLLGLRESSPTYSDEFRLRSADERLLRDVARVSGGRYDLRPEDVFSRRSALRDRATPSAHWLLLAAALLFAADVFLKRVNPSENRRGPHDRSSVASQAGTDSPAASVA
ncbi:MAG: glutamine amidotransferase, partial [Planctomycetales bacterium]